MVELIAIACGVFVGLALGLTGGGGSLFAVPLLVYALQQPAEKAIPISLAVVALTALVGAIDAIKQQLVLYRQTFIFALAGMLTAPLGLYLGGSFNSDIRMFLFGILTLILSVRMWIQANDSKAILAVRAKLQKSPLTPVCRYSSEGSIQFTPKCATAITLAGITTGLLSGFFGVGGGFLIVPILMLVTQITIHQAVASSLVIISLIGFSGVAFSQQSLSSIDTTIIIFAAGSLGGMLFGRTLAKHITASLLQKIFSFSLIVAGLFIITKQVIAL